MKPQLQERESIHVIFVSNNITHTFSAVKHFVGEIKRGGVGAMELVAMHMKAQGQYLARNLSFQGATFEICEQVLSKVFTMRLSLSL